MPTVPALGGCVRIRFACGCRRCHFNFLSPFIKEGALALDDEDELVKGIRLTGNGTVVHPNFAAKED